MLHKHSLLALVGLSVSLVLAACSDDAANTLGERNQTAVAAVLTTDVGAEIDDQWAMAHLLMSPEIDLRAIVTTHASSIRLSSATTAEAAMQVLARVLADSPSARPPVQAGSALALSDSTTPRDNAGVDLLLDVSRDFSPSRRLVVFMMGAATDVASAMLKDPLLAERITVVAMGFNDWPAGGDVFNVVNDPLAWQVILDSDVPVVIGSAAVARQGLALTRSAAESLMSPHGELGEYLNSLFAGWLDVQAALVAQIVAPDTWVIWDEVVVAYALGMTRGEEVPRPRLQSDLSFAHEDTERRITWLTSIDTDKVWIDFTRKIDALR
jgi:inosine-uridine nucleoside N-ribohydrolase